MAERIDMSFIKDFNKELSKMAGVGTSSKPPNYWYSTGNKVLNKIISGNYENGIPQGRVTIVCGDSGSGKAQPLSAKVLTPNGFVHMGDLIVGDEVVTPSGEISNIIAIHPQGKKDIYGITFSDGSYTECCLDHLWECSLTKIDTDNKATKVVLTTNELIDLWNNVPNGNPISIDMITPMDATEVDLPFTTPYTLGCMLGDENNVGYKELIGSDKSPQDSILIWTNRYWHGSINQRLELIQGLFDTCGVVSNTSVISFSTSSHLIAKAIQPIIWSIGAKCLLVPSYNSSSDNVSYELHTFYTYPKQLFKLQSKKDMCNDGYNQISRQISNIQQLQPQEAQCITIDHPSSLYITDDYIVTHNSFLGANITKSAQQSGAYCLVIDSENALDDLFMSKIGVDVDDGYKYVGVKTIAQVINVVSSFLKGYKKQYSDDPDAPQVFITIDSLDMLMTETELATYDKGDQKGDQGQRSKQLKSMLRSFVQDIKHLNVTMLCVSQVYKNQDLLNGLGPWIVGDAVKYACSQIILLSKLKLKDDSGKAGQFAGIRMKCEGYKTRFTKPFQTITIEIPYETGMDQYSGLLDAAVGLGIVERRGSRYAISGSTESWYEKDWQPHIAEILEKCNEVTNQSLKADVSDSDMLVE